MRTFRRLEICHVAKVLWDGSAVGPLLQDAREHRGLARTGRPHHEEVEAAVRDLQAQLDGPQRARLPHGARRALAGV